MNKRKLNKLDNKDVAETKKNKFTIEEWLRSSSSDATTLAIDVTVENNISTLNHKSDEESSADSFLTDEADIEITLEEDNDSTLKENVATLDRLATFETCESSADQTDIESERTTSSTSFTHDKSYTLPDCFEKVGSGRKNIRCKVCFSQIGVVSVFINNGKHHIPAICTQTGTQNRKAFVDAHLKSLCHESAVKSQRLATLRTDQLVDESTIERGISKQNHQLFIKICRQMVTVYNDSKRGTLSAYSWPSREIAFLKGADYEKTSHIPEKFEPKRTDLQYLFPDHHSDLLNCIVEVDKPNIKTKIKNALAASIRCDGSVDRTQLHNIHVMINIIEDDGSSSLIFLGFAEPRGNNKATEYYNSVKGAAGRIIDWAELLSIISSIATDGENLNSDEKGGLWVLIEKDKKSGSPFIKIWCAVHRQNLAFEKMSSTNPEIGDLIKEASSLSTHFHSSSVRTFKINEIAETNKYKYVHYPSYFEVRWTEFTNSLLEAILKNWRASMKYFVDEKLIRLKGVWLDKNRIHLTCLLSDMSFIYKRFQKSFESDSITIFDVQPQIEKTLAKFTEMLEKPVLSGWEEVFLENISLVETRFGKEIFKFHGYVLTDNNSHKEFSELRKDVIESMIEFLKEMFECDSNLRENISPLRLLDPDTSVEQLKKCYEVACPDLEFRLFCQEYFELACVEEYQECSPVQLLKILCRNKDGQFDTIKKALARLVAAKPHSADVERIIHAYNKLKSKDRANIGPLQLQNQLHVKLNMGPLDVFNPTEAAIKWLTDKKRRDRPVLKKKQEEFFKGVFSEADTRKTKPVQHNVGF